MKHHFLNLPSECHLKKVAGTQPTKNVEKAEVVNALRTRFPLELLLRLMALARSVFFYHLKPKVDKNAAIKQEVVKIYHENDGRYGYRRVTLELRKIMTINHKCVQSIM